MSPSRLLLLLLLLPPPTPTPPPTQMVIATAPPPQLPRALLPLLLLLLLCLWWVQGARSPWPHPPPCKHREQGPVSSCCCLPVGARGTLAVVAVALVLCHHRRQVQGRTQAWQQQQRRRGVAHCLSSSSSWMQGTACLTLGGRAGTRAVTVHTAQARCVPWSLVVRVSVLGCGLDRSAVNDLELGWR